MKITKTSQQAAAEREREKIAKRSCDICPCCGEAMSSAEAIRRGFGLQKGISDISTSRLTGSWPFREERKTVVSYHCHTCGAQWESGPF